MPLWSYASTTNSAAFSSELRQFIEHVWQINPGIQSAIAQVEEAKANATASNRPLYNPELEFDG
ncbi:MAG: TolC family protein, partial [Thermoproteota archaeon]|nr:TolC family protein [Thermoproteota archaeon]